MQQEQATQPHIIQLMSRRLFYSLLCGAKSNNKIIPAAQPYIEIDIPADLHKTLVKSSLAYSDM